MCQISEVQAGGSEVQGHHLLCIETETLKTQSHINSSKSCKLSKQLSSKGSHSDWAHVNGSLEVLATVFSPGRLSYHR